MNEVSSGGSNPWDIYTSPDPMTNPTTQAGGLTNQEGQWQPTIGGGGGSGSGGGTSSALKSALSFGFVATAILITMFIVMAIFEHLLRPKSPSSSTSTHHQDSADDEGSLESGRQSQDQMHIFGKIRSPPNVAMSYRSDIPVMMPGQKCPTFIAQPAPLNPCRREGIHWPNLNDPSFVDFVTP